MLELPLLLAGLCAAASTDTAQPQPWDWPALKAGWRQRIIQVGKGQLPLVDDLSTFSGMSLGAARLKEKMDGAGVAWMAVSPWLGEEFEEASADADRSEALRKLMASGPDYFMPIPAADLDGAGALKRLLDAALRDGYPFLGEFRFRSYPPNRLWFAGPARAQSDEKIPIDGPLGQMLFSFSQEHGLPFLILYEVEDPLLPPLEKMLARYPGAKVVWRRLGQVCYKERSRDYGPRYVEGLLEKYPNLYFDFSWTDARDYYVGSREFTSVLWDRRSGNLDDGWRRLILRHPWRFMSGLGLSPDTWLYFDQAAAARRRLLGQLPPEVGEIVAYKAVWRFLFGEDL